MDKYLIYENIIIRFLENLEKARNLDTHGNYAK